MHNDASSASVKIAIQLSTRVLAVSRRIKRIMRASRHHLHYLHVASSRCHFDHQGLHRIRCQLRWNHLHGSLCQLHSRCQLDRRSSHRPLIHRTCSCDCIWKCKSKQRRISSSRIGSGIGCRCKLMSSRMRWLYSIRFAIPHQPINGKRPV